MMLTKKESDWINVLVEQAPRDCAYMAPHVDDPQSQFTRGIISRHTEMAHWLWRLLEHVESAQAHK